VATMLDSALAMWDNGMRVIPLQGKKALIPWAKYQNETPTQEDVEAWWGRWPTANVGIITGKDVVVVDADSRESIKWVIDNLPRTPWAAQTGKGMHFYYGVSDFEIRNSVNVDAKVDVRGMGGYVVGPPSKHASGKRYRWVIDKAAGAQSFDDLPCLSREDIAHINAYNGVEKKAEYLFDSTTIRDAHDGSPVEEGGRNNAAASLVGQYIHEGHDLKSIKGLLTQWNDTNPDPLERDELDTTLASVVTTHLRNNPDDALAIEHEGFEPKPIEGIAVKGVPAHLLEVPGALGAICEFINRTAIYPQPVLSLAAALPILGTLYGRYYRSPTNLRTNIYSCSIGFSGSGKEHPLHCADQLFNESGMGERLGTGRMSSAQGLLKHCQRSPATMLAIDEFGLMLKSLTSKHASTHKADIMATLLELFSRAKGTFRGMQYADTDGNRPRVDIFQPCVSLYGTTTPNHFYESLKSTQVMDGFLNRLIIFDIGNSMPERQEPITLEPPEPLIRYFKMVRSYIKSQQGHGADIANGGIDIPLHTVPISPEAKEYLGDYEKNIRQQMVEYRSTGTDALWSRAYEHAVKVAMIRAIGVDFKRPEVSLADVTWGCELVTNQIKTTVVDVVDRVADSEHERTLKSVLRHITREGTSQADLTIKTRAVPRDQRQKILKDLIDGGQVTMKRHKPKKGRPTTYYVRTQGNG